MILYDQELSYAYFLVSLLLGEGKGNADSPGWEETHARLKENSLMRRNVRFGMLVAAALLVTAAMGVNP
ncbi:MAG TPA: hypothetical protein VLE27_03795, partial [Thermoanaerobaculia bacterium]|nr:hypothetical protein [Thermoanaerobaculia bacterium]